MGYTTAFEGQIFVHPPLNPSEIKYLRKFADTRRMKRTKGPYFVDGTGVCGQGRDADIENFNVPPAGQPSLWCDWTPTDDGTAIEWDLGEKFYYSTEWMRYLIDHFLKEGGHAQGKPGFEEFTFNHTLMGIIHAEGEDHEDVWDLVVYDNHVWGEEKGGDDPRPTKEIIALAAAATACEPGTEGPSQLALTEAKDAPSMNTPLVNFPGAGDRFRDSGEGGLFVMMVVPEPDGWDDDCCVDVGIMLTRPDVCLSPQKANLWGPDKDWLANKRIEREILAAAEDKPDWKRWIFQTYPHEDLSVNVLSATHLGSTHQSLWDERMGEYWRATTDDLTATGKALYDALRIAYGVDPILLTFLDT